MVGFLVPGIFPVKLPQPNRTGPLWHIAGTQRAEGVYRPPNAGSGGFFVAGRVAGLAMSLNARPGCNCGRLCCPNVKNAVFSIVFELETLEAAKR